MAIRYLWITIRAINYTDRAFKAISKSIGALQKDEAKLAQTANVLKMSAGMMWVALGAMAVSGMMQMMRATREGRAVMRDFDKSVGALSKSLGQAFTTVLGQAIRILTGLLNAIAKIPAPILTMITAMGVLILMYGMFRASAWVLSGTMGMLGVSFKLVGPTIQAYIGDAMAGVVSTDALKMSISGLNVSISTCVMFFMAFVMIGMMFGKTAGIIVAGIGGIIAALIIYTHWQKVAAILQGTLNWWSAAAMIAGGLAIGGAIAALTSFQVGTRKAQFTGPAIVHAGERVGKESQLKKEFGGKQGVEKTQTNVTIAFSGNIQTKADKEQLRPLILKCIKDALDNKA